MSASSLRILTLYAARSRPEKSCDRGDSVLGSRTDPRELGLRTVRSNRFGFDWRSSLRQSPERPPSQRPAGGYSDSQEARELTCQPPRLSMDPPPHATVLDHSTLDYSDRTSDHTPSHEPGPMDRDGFATLVLLCRQNQRSKAQRIPRCRPITSSTQEGQTEKTFSDRELPLFCLVSCPFLLLLLFN